MKKTDIVKFLHLIGGENIKEANEWVRASCPFAPYLHSSGSDSRPSFGISIGPQSHYHCFSCQKSGPLTLLVTSLCMLEGKDNMEAREFVMTHEELAPRSYEELKDDVPLSTLSPLVLKKFVRAHPGLSFCKERGITQADINEWELYWDSYQGRLIIPVFNKKRRLVGIRGRTMGDGKPKYKEYSELYPTKTSPKAHGVWFGENFMEVPDDHRLILVEGELDAIAIRRALSGVNTRRYGILASMGASLAEKQVRAIQALKNPLLLFFDNDEAGMLAKMKILKKVKPFNPNIKCVTDYAGCKDPAEMVERGVLRRAFITLDKC